MPAIATKRGWSYLTAGPRHGYVYLVWPSNTATIFWFRAKPVAREHEHSQVLGSFRSQLDQRRHFYLPTYSPRPISGGVCVMLELLLFVLQKQVR